MEEQIRLGEFELMAFAVFAKVSAIVNCALFIVNYKESGGEKYERY